LTRILTLVEYRYEDFLTFSTEYDDGYGDVQIRHVPPCHNTLPPYIPVPSSGTWTKIVGGPN